MIKAIKVSLALGVAALAPQLSVAGPIWAANGHEYELVRSQLSWTDARNAAAAAGWYLATVTSQAEHDFLVANVLPGTATDRTHFWLGASDAETEGSFEWITGEVSAFHRFWGGEPNNAGNEDYLAYDYRNGWGWNDADNTISCCTSFLQGYIRERSVNAVPEPATLALLGLGLLGVGLARRRAQ